MNATAPIGPSAGLPDPAFWRGRRVLVTGHTGFIGGWLCAWLHAMGSDVSGMALALPEGPSFYRLSGLGGRLQDTIADIRSAEAVAQIFNDARPEIVFHLAAQAIVSEAYHAPAETFDVNVMGTIRMLDEARRHVPLALVAITSDKVYAAGDASRAHVEVDRLGPSDPYGSSKACCELAVDAYAKSFLEAAGIGSATVRAGNVIGGGDWGAARLVPDAIRAFSAGLGLSIRSPDAVRPWQHVLDAVNGLLLVAERTARERRAIGAWNIGPPGEARWNVGALARMVASAWQGNTSDTTSVTADAKSGFPETGYLAIDSSRARHELHLRPPWSLEQAVCHTVAWYKQALAGDDAWGLTQAQISAYRVARMECERAGAAD